MTADRSNGVIVWTEQTENIGEIVRRLDFTVNENGVLSLGAPVTVLPLAGEEALPGDELRHRAIDIWGDATHNSLYMTVRQHRRFNSGPDAGGGTRDLMIYDLHDLTGNLAGPAPDMRLLFHLGLIPGAENEYGDWLDADPMSLRDCTTVNYPQFVPTCYLAEEVRFNPSGTRLYLQRPINLTDPDSSWDTVMRIHLDMGGGSSLADWTLTGPELVYTGRDSGDRIAPGGMVPRPENDVSVLPSPEYIAVTHRVEGAITEFASILNADQCAAEFIPYAGGNLEGPPDLWYGCIDTDTFFPGNRQGRGDSWQSPETLLKSSYQDPDYDIHRVYVSGALAGTEQLMIETARFANSGN